VPTLAEIRAADPNRILNIDSFEIRVGALNRRQVRIELDGNGYDYKEYKGLLDSIFIVSGRMTCAKFLALADWVKANEAG